MKENRNARSNFEERLLGELKAVVAKRGAEAEEEVSAEAPGAHSPGCRRASRLAVGAAAILAAAAAVLIFNSGASNTPNAFAKAFVVEPQHGGGETIKIYSPEDATGLERALRKAGIRSQVSWLAAGMTCREPRFTPSTAKLSAGGDINGGGLTQASSGKPVTFGVMSHQQYRKHPNASISLDPTSFRPDQTAVITGSRGPYYGRGPEGGFETHIAIAEGPVKPCEPVKVPHGGLLGATNRLLKSEARQSDRTSGGRSRSTSRSHPAPAHASTTSGGGGSAISQPASTAAASGGSASAGSPIASSAKGGTAHSPQPNGTGTAAGNHTPAPDHADGSPTQASSGGGLSPVLAIPITVAVLAAISIAAVMTWQRRNHGLPGVRR